MKSEVVQIVIAVSRMSC